MIRCSCLCGSVRYEILCALGRATNCHCSQCRKAHGAAFGSYALGVNWADFKLVSGESEIGAYEAPPGVRRTFCKRCGSTLQFIRDARPESFSLALGTLDDDPGIQPSAHIFVGSKAPWFEITDAPPQYRERPA